MDAFAELGLERSLTLDGESLKAAVTAAGKERHPDAGGTAEDFARLQQAKGLLERPVSRLKHWLELEKVPGDMRGTVSDDLMAVFSEMGVLLQQTDELLREREKVSSALAKAMLEGRVQECREKLEAMQDRLGEMVEVRVERFGSIEVGGTDGWEVARDLGFLAKWQGEVRDRFARLW
ncbi:hypothetical protein HAHE_28210 [Haloferula helveola]|uniref:J domain-containing protein n=1 Tax=Haloferula helveola TaxID=490095 RepID=A0ABM7RNV4_9BACT|nr:hypothetical protein HAHE_28210 [Haloferula helveola]